MVPGDVNRGIRRHGIAVEERAINRVGPVVQGTRSEEANHCNPVVTVIWRPPAELRSSPNCHVPVRCRRVRGDRDADTECQHKDNA